MAEEATNRPAESNGLTEGYRVFRMLLELYTKAPEAFHRAFSRFKIEYPGGRSQYDLKAKTLDAVFHDAFDCLRGSAKKFGAPMETQITEGYKALNDTYTKDFIPDPKAYLERPSDQKNYGFLDAIRIFSNLANVEEVINAVMAAEKMKMPEAPTINALNYEESAAIIANSVPLNTMADIEALMELYTAKFNKKTNHFSKESAAHYQMSKFMLNQRFVVVKECGINIPDDGDRHLIHISVDPDAGTLTIWDQVKSSSGSSYTDILIPIMSTGAWPNRRD